MKRVFVGIPINEDLRLKILEWRKGFSLSVIPSESQSDWDEPRNPLTKEKGSLRSPSDAFGFGRDDTKKDTGILRWIEAKNLHVTLVPPWEIGDEAWNMEHEALTNQLAKTAKEFGPFEIKFNSISFGPNLKEPRMIWATGQAGEEIRELKKSIEIALVDNTRTYADAKQKFVGEFKMHITLARFKNITPLPPLILRGGDNIDWRMQVSSFVLYQSHLSPSGADYEALEEFKLSDANMQMASE